MLQLWNQLPKGNLRWQLETAQSCWKHLQLMAIGHSRTHQTVSTSVFKKQKGY